MSRKPTIDWAKVAAALMEKSALEALDAQKFEAGHQPNIAMAKMLAASILSSLAIALRAGLK